MKKLFLLLLTVSLMGCSSEDDQLEEKLYADEIEILEHNWTASEIIEDRVKVLLNAKIKNETRGSETGRLIFTRYRNSDNPGESNIILYTEVFTVPKGETIIISEVIEEGTIKKSHFEDGYDDILFEFEENVQEWDMAFGD